MRGCSEWSRIGSSTEWRRLGDSGPLAERGSLMTYRTARKIKRAPCGPVLFFSPSVVADENPVRPTQPRSGMLAGSLRSERAESHPLRQQVWQSFSLLPETCDCLVLSGVCGEPFVYVSGPPGGSQAGIGSQVGLSLCGRFRQSGISLQESQDMRVGRANQESSQTAGRTQTGV